MTNGFPLNCQFRAIDDLFENIFSDLDDPDEFLNKYDECKKQFLQLPVKNKINFTGFCLLIEELSEYLMLPEVQKKMKISYVIFWQKSANKSIIDDIMLENNKIRVVPKFFSTKKAVARSPNSESPDYSFTINSHLLSLMNEYKIEYNSMLRNKEELNRKFKQANTLLTERNEIIKVIVQNKIKYYNRKNINQSERRNLRVITDLMYLIDTMNRDLKKKANNNNKK